jgi:hypothetical protein
MLGNDFIQMKDMQNKKYLMHIEYMYPPFTMFGSHDHMKSTHYKNEDVYI